jgi:hypothetical protein
MATEAAWLNGNRLTERRKRKCALTSTGLLMEGLDELWSAIPLARTKTVRSRTTSFASRPCQVSRTDRHYRNIEVVADGPLHECRISGNLIGAAALLGGAE